MVVSAVESASRPTSSDRHVEAHNQRGTELVVSYRRTTWWPSERHDELLVRGLHRRWYRCYARSATIDEVENNFITKQVMNTAQGHWNEEAMRGSPMGDGRLVFGSITGSLTVGLTAESGHGGERRRRAR